MPMVFFTPDMDKALLEHWDKNYPISIIADYIGVSGTVIKRRRDELGLPERPQARSHRVARECNYA